MSEVIPILMAAGVFAWVFWLVVREDVTLWLIEKEWGRFVLTRRGFRWRWGKSRAEERLHRDGIDVTEVAALYLRGAIVRVAGEPIGAPFFVVCLDVELNPLVDEVVYRATIRSALDRELTGFHIYRIGNLSFAVAPALVGKIEGTTIDFVASDFGGHLRVHTPNIEARTNCLMFELKHEDGFPRQSLN